MNFFLLFIYLFIFFKTKIYNKNMKQLLFCDKQTKYEPLRASEPYLFWVVSDQDCQEIEGEAKILGMFVHNVLDVKGWV